MDSANPTTASIHPGVIFKSSYLNMVIDGAVEKFIVVIKDTLNGKNNIKNEGFLWIEGASGLARTLGLHRKGYQEGKSITAICVCIVNIYLRMHPCNNFEI